jgi:hypothetical protein
VSALRRKKPKLYFASVDVERCYDMIDTDRLLGILEGTPGGDRSRESVHALCCSLSGS